jgi:hypothetical protein
MILRKFTVLKQIRWAEFQVEFLSLIFVLDLLAFLWAKKKPECCDANSYFFEGSQSGPLDFIRVRAVDPEAVFHNYLYPVFIFTARSLGLTTRSGITILQFVLIILACIFVSARLVKVMRMPFTKLFGFSLLIAFVPILAFSGYLLTESLASALLILWVGLWIEFSLRSLSRWGREIFIITLALLSALIWMARPSFLWVPITNVICLLLMDYERRTANFSVLKNMVKTTTLAFIVTVVVTIPQYFASRTSMSFLDGIFHTRGWTAYQTIEANVYRYVTNLSGCGPEQLFFSPYGQTAIDVNSPNSHIPPVLRFSGFIARVVTGWDAVPSPLTYVYNLGVFPWVLLTAITGFLICAPIFLVFPWKNSLARGENNYRILELGLVFTFVVSQLAVGITHGEFRYNVAGWILTGFALLLLPQHFKSGFPWKRYITTSLLVSLFVITVGQLTLSLSQAWVACVK